MISSRQWCSLCVVLCFGQAAHAQTYGTIFPTWELTEVHTGTTTPVANQTGVLSPGKSLMFTLSVSFDPPVGTIVHAPHFPPSGHPIAGFGSYLTAIEGTGGAEGTWTDEFSPSPWIFMGDVSAGGAFYMLNVGQPTWVPGTVVDPSNPIPAIWRGVWTPDSYDPRTISWDRGAAGTGQLLVQTGTDPGTGAPTYAGVRAELVQGPLGQIAIVPAPAGALVLIFGSAMAFRRRR